MRGQLFARSENGCVNCVVSFAHFAAFSFIGCANYELFLFFFALFLALWYTCLAVQPIVVQQKRRKNQISNTAPTTFAVRKVKVKSRRDEKGKGQRQGLREGDEQVDSQEIHIARANCKPSKGGN